MATNANPYVINIVPLQGIATGITSSSDTAGQITTIQANVANLQAMVNYDTRTISADYITSFTDGNTIQVTNDINLSSVSLYSNGSLTAGTQILQTDASTLTISGNLTVSGNAYVRELFQTSDRSMKTNIKPFTTCLDEILTLTPYTFNWIDSGKEDIGFIAQEVQQVWPSLTSEGTSIAYSRFVPLLLEGLRELNERVRTLEGLSKK